jgi:hypothetical protein
MGSLSSMQRTAAVVEAEKAGGGQPGTCVCWCFLATE